MNADPYPDFDEEFRCAACGRLFKHDEHREARHHWKVNHPNEGRNYRFYPV